MPTAQVHWNRSLLIFAALMGLTAIVALIGIFVDPRILTGVPIWLKPFKFAISLGLYTATLAWMLTLLPRRSRVAEAAAVVIVATATAEILVIVTQVLRGTTSHYNETTPLNSALWQVMGSSILVLFLAHFVIAVIVARRPLADRTSTYAVRLGLGLTLLGMLAAVPMVQPGAAPGIEGVTGSHTVGLNDGGPGLPLVGWSTVGGDLRIGHFVGLHALQVLPLLAILLRLAAGRLSATLQARLLLVSGVAYAGLTVSLTVQALRGQPLLQPDALTLAIWFGLAAATATAATLVVARSPRPELALAS